ncbi:Eukaryotic translation initiation factor 2C [Boothiomyces sp. JEL0866]|nr:Eukaryotic translation initiation factor 2C [Boothiomyces sp. JEL0866]
MFPKRPDQGTIGRPIQVRSNFFSLTSLPTSQVHHYSVSIIPDVPPAKNRKIFQLWETASNEMGILDGVKPVFDGRFNMYSPKPMPFDDMAVFLIDYYEEDEFPPCENPTLKCLERVPKKFEMTLTKITSVSMDSLRLYLKGLSSEVPTEALAVLDVVMRQRPSLTFTTVGRCFYTPDAAVTIANGVQLWQGFHQSLKPANGQLLINLDVSATAFYQAGPVVNIAAKILGKHSPLDIRGPLSEKDRQRIEKGVRGLKIVVVHRGQIRRKYKIAKLTTTDSHRTTFPLNESGSEETVANYFLNKYKMELTFPQLPLIVVGESNRPIYLPMEVCEIVPGQRHMKKLNERQTSEMIKFTCQPPHIRSNKIAAGITLLQQKDDAYLKDFGIEVGREMLNVPARVLPPPTISYHPASKEPSITPSEGSWNLRDKMVAQGVSLISWSVVVFGTEQDIPVPSCQKFITLLCQTCEECGVFVKAKQPPITYASANGNIEKILIDAYMVAGNSYQARPQLVLCILPNTGVPLYAEIKRVSDTVVGVATQCIQAKHLYAAKRQYCANVCLKMNVKLGGMNSYLSNVQLPFIGQKPTIVIGADVTHPAVGSSASTSIAALVGSLDAQCSRYSAAIRSQKGRMEWIQDLSGMLIEILKTFYKTTGVKPVSILLYRDAVSESQFQEVLKRELESMLQACETLETGYRPAITYVAVQKRHHARFFPIKKEDSDKSGNVLPGTIVEQKITHPSEYDFYLCSHPGLQGTSKPTHYHVLHDENNLNSNTLQELTYRLCYLYCRATRSVSVVPPAYYAHLVATRARFHTTDNDEEYNRPSSMYSSITAREKAFGVVKPELSNVMYFM